MTDQITNGSEETSTVLPFVVRADGQKMAPGRYPFVEPSTGYERAWWDEMRRLAREGGRTTRTEMAARLKAWAPVLRAMTPTERQEFHDERHLIASSFMWDIDSVRGEGERTPAEATLLSKWTLRVAGRNP